LARRQRQGGSASSSSSAFASRRSGVLNPSEQRLLARVLAIQLRRAPTRSPGESPPTRAQFQARSNRNLRTSAEPRPKATPQSNLSSERPSWRVPRSHTFLKKAMGPCGARRLPRAASNGASRRSRPTSCLSMLKLKRVQAVMFRPISPPRTSGGLGRSSPISEEYPR
jgi:hypothetical protein